MAVKTFEDFRKARLECKAAHTTPEEVQACLAPHRVEMAKVLGNSPNTRGAFACLPAEKAETHFVDDLAQIAKIGSFDVGMIDSITPLELPDGKILCLGGNMGRTSIDDVRLLNGDRYFIKHGGSISDPKADIAVYSEIQLIAAVLDEDIPNMVWSNPSKGRFAMTEMVSKATRGTRWEEVRPHELLTSLTFEMLINDSDRNSGNLVELAPGVIGHLDFGDDFIGKTLQHKDLRRGSGIARQVRLTREKAVRSGNAGDFMDSMNPGFSDAVRQTYINWRRDWRPTLMTIGPNVKQARLQPRGKLIDQDVNPELLSKAVLDKTEDYLATLVAEMGWSVSELRKEAQKPAKPPTPGLDKAAGIRHPLVQYVRQHQGRRARVGKIKDSAQSSVSLIDLMESTSPSVAPPIQADIPNNFDEDNKFFCDNYAQSINNNAQAINQLANRGGGAGDIGRVMDSLENDFLRFRTLDITPCQGHVKHEFDNMVNFRKLRSQLENPNAVWSVCDAMSNMVSVYRDYMEQIVDNGGRTCSFNTALEPVIKQIMESWRDGLKRGIVNCSIDPVERKLLEIMELENQVDDRCKPMPFISSDPPPSLPKELTPPSIKAPVFEAEIAVAEPVASSQESIDLLDQAIAEMAQVVLPPDPKPKTPKSRPKRCKAHMGKVQDGLMLVATAMIKQDCTKKTREKIEDMADKVFGHGVGSDLEGCPDVMKAELRLHTAIANRWTECLAKKPPTKYQKMIAQIDALSGFVDFIGPEPKDRDCNTLQWASAQEDDIWIMFQGYRDEGFPKEGTFDMEKLIKGELDKLGAIFAKAEVRCVGS